MGVKIAAFSLLIPDSPGYHSYPSPLQLLVSGGHDVICVGVFLFKIQLLFLYSKSRLLGICEPEVQYEVGSLFIRTV